MNNPFFNSIQTRFLYFSIWAVIIIAQILLFYYFIPYGIEIIIPDSLITNSLQAICIFLLWYPVRYYRNVFNIPLFLLFHLFLFVFSLGIWLGLGYIVTTLFVEQSHLYKDFYLEFLPLRMVLGLLIYVIFVLVYYFFMISREIKEKQKKLDESEMKSLTGPQEKLDRISVKKRNAIQILPVEKICYIEANGDYVFIHTETERYLRDRTMKYWETHLPDAHFIRIHRSFIVNVDYIRTVELYEKETYRVYMKNDTILRASASGYKLLKRRIV